nr:hypothetical protein [Paenibacillus larvae]
MVQMLTWFRTSRQHYNPVLPQKKKKVAFTTNPKTGEEHMSFYKSGIKEIVAENMFDAITDAIADLHEDYRENAKNRHALPGLQEHYQSLSEW